jgi:hypothetical protein
MHRLIKKLKFMTSFSAFDTATNWLWFMSGSDREGTETGRRLP